MSTLWYLSGSPFDVRCLLSLVFLSVCLFLGFVVVVVFVVLSRLPFFWREWVLKLPSVNGLDVLERVGAEIAQC